MDSYAMAQSSPASSVVSLVCAILTIIAFWKIFTKAGEKGWKAIIPIYNAYTAYKLFWNKKMFWITFILAFVAVIVGSIGIGSLGVFMAMGAADGVAVLGVILTILFVIMLIALCVLSIIYYNKLSKSFGHGAGFTVGLIFLNLIFMLILAFGSSEYKKLEN